MRDFLPADKALRDGVMGAIRRSFSTFGYQEIETPVAEELSRLESGQGGDNEKLIFKILKRGLDPTEAITPAQAADLGLRFDLTVPLSRYYATHRAELPAVFRSIQIAPVWRAERPQKGRFRQFTQCDIDVIGEASNLAEVELVTAMVTTLGQLGIEDAVVRINDRRVLQGILDDAGFDPAVHPRVLITVDKLDKVGISGVADELAADGADPTAVDRLIKLLDAVTAGGSAGATAHGGGGSGVAAGGVAAGGVSAGGVSAGGVSAGGVSAGGVSAGAVSAGAVSGGGRIAAAGGVATESGPAAAGSFEATLAALPGVVERAAADLLAIRDALALAAPTARLVADPTLVRGMGYYTGTIFEIAHPASTGSIAGGGRYDGMIGRFAGTDVPACGFSIGFERIIDLVDPARFAPTRRRVALLYDDGADPGAVVAGQRRLIDDGADVRVVRRARNAGRQLGSLAAEGFTAYATLPTPSEGPGVSGPLALRPLSPHPDPAGA
jgi:histidyl-tRNA synthetase